MSSDDQENQPNESILVEYATPRERRRFILLVLTHFLGSIILFVGLEIAIQASPIPTALLDFIEKGGTAGIVACTVLFVGLGFPAFFAVGSREDRASQYAGTAIYIAVQTLIVSPLLLVVARFVAEGYFTQDLRTAAIGLGIVLFVLSFFFYLVVAEMKPFAAVVCFSIPGFLAAGSFFGFSLGLVIVYTISIISVAGIVGAFLSILKELSLEEYVSGAFTRLASITLVYCFAVMFIFSKIR